MGNDCPALTEQFVGVVNEQNESFHPTNAMSLITFVANAVIPAYRQDISRSYEESVGKTSRGAGAEMPARRRRAAPLQRNFESAC